MSKSLKAIHDDDLNPLLERLNLLGKYNSGQLKCSFCGNTINFDNLHSFYRDSGNIKLICSKPDCVTALISRLQEKNYE